MGSWATVIIFDAVLYIKSEPRGKLRSAYGFNPCFLASVKTIRCWGKLYRPPHLVERNYVGIRYRLQPSEEYWVEVGYASMVYYIVDDGLQIYHVMGEMFPAYM